MHSHCTVDIMNNSQTVSEFEALLKKSFEKSSSFEKSDSETKRIVTGTIVAIKGNDAIIDVGLKSEGCLNINDIKSLKDSDDVSVGDTIEVYIERFEDKHGSPVLSIEKAKKEAVWQRLTNCFINGDMITGVITNKTKGGFIVDINGTSAFLPGSQIDVRVIKDISSLFGVEQQFKILKMERSRNNIVVSRRAVVEIERNAARGEILSQLEEGMVMDGIVKNITEYGAFVDIGGIDGLLHVTDMSWRRISSPNEVVKIGDKIKVQIVKFNRDTGRVSLGIKQLSETPWNSNVQERYKIGEIYKGKVVNITDYGAFVELEPCIEGMVYRAELSWIKNIIPSNAVTVGDEVNVKVLEVVPDKHKISLSIKRCQPNPCEQFLAEHPVGSIVSGKIRGIKEFGIFVGLTDVLDGTVAMRDVSWDMTYEEELTRTNIGIDSRAKGYEVGQTVETKVLIVDPNREIIRLGIKQLSEDPYAKALEAIKKDDVVHGKVTKIGTEGMVVTLESGLPCLLKRLDVGRDGTKKFADYKEGDEVDALVVTVHVGSRYVQLSVNALDAKNQRAVLKKVNSENMKSKLGDVLGDALNKK